MIDRGRRTAASLAAALACGEVLAADERQQVVVTATRAPTAWIDAPASVTAIAADAIDRLGATHHADVLNTIAGVNLQRGSGQESLTAIRSPVLTGPGACGAFLALEDGLPIRPVGFCNVNALFELNTEQAGRIEVVRGPGAGLYGANAVHGIVDVRSPSAGELPGARLALEGGSDDYRRAKAALRAGDEERAFVARGVYTHDGGFRADSGFDEGKLNLAWEQPLGGGRLALRAAGTVLNQETAGFIEGFKAYEDPALVASNPNPEAFRDAWSARVSAAWTASRCDGCEDRLQVLLRRSDMTFLQHFLLGQPLEENGQRSAVVAAGIARPIDARWRWRAAVDAEVVDGWLVETQAGPVMEGSAAARAIRPAGRHYDYVVEGLTASGTLRLEGEPVPRWRVGAGARLERTRYDYDNRMIDGNTDENGVPCPFGGCLFARPADRSDTFTNVAPSVDVSFAPTDRQRVYATASRGFRPPEMTELYRLQRQQTVAMLDSERLDALELGWRAEGRNAALALAAFALEKRDVILRDANAFNVSDGRTTHRGFEYEAQWSANGALTLEAHGTVAWHRYAFSANVEGGERIRDGADVDTAPRHVHGATIEWSPSTRASLALRVEHVGRHAIDAANTREYDGHTLLHARGIWDLSPALRLTLRVTNLTDEAYADRADFAFGEYRYFPGRGRSAFVEIDWRTE